MHRHAPFLNYALQSISRPRIHAKFPVQTTLRGLPWTRGDAFEICSKSRLLVLVTSNLGQNMSKQPCINNGRTHSESLCLQIVLMGCVTCTANCALFASGTVQCHKVIKNSLNCRKSLKAGKATVLSSAMESSHMMSHSSAPYKFNE